MAEVQSSSRFRRWAIMGLAAVILVPLLAFTLWAWITLNFAYSTGERAGYVQKISRSRATNIQLLGSR